MPYANRNEKLSEKIFIIDATPLHFGGGKIVLEAFLNGLQEINFKERFKIYLHPKIETPHIQGVEFIQPTKKYPSLHKFFRIFLFLFGFNFICSVYKILGKKIVFISLANFPVLMLRLHRQYVLVHQSHATPAGSQWRSLYGRSMPVKRRVELTFISFLLKILYRIERVDVIVQTQFMVQQVKLLLGEKAKVHLVRQGLKVLHNPIQAVPEIYRLIALTRGYAHKHLEDLVLLCNLIDTQKLPIQIMTTLGDDPYEEHIKQLLSPYKAWQNLGPLSHSQALVEIGRSTALLWTSKLESLGLPIMEGIAAGIPVIVFHPTSLTAELLGEYAVNLDLLTVNSETLMDVCKAANALLHDPLRRQNYRKRIDFLLLTPAQYVGEFLAITS